MRSSTSLLRAALLVPLSWACALAATAATVTVHVARPGGAMLDSAVVLLRPVDAHLPLKPLAGIEIAQRDKQFAPQLTVVTVGTSVLFPNQDTVRHHVYSFSPIKSFELKLYAGTPHEPVVFDKPGIATLGCNIHDQMIAWVVVSDTPFFARTGPDGTARFPDVPPGNYRLWAWHPKLPENARPLVQDVAIATADLERQVQLDVAVR